MSLERRARAYIAALEGGATGEELASFYHPDAVEDEYPNRRSPAGARRDLEGILREAETSQRIMARQIFEILTATVTGDRVVLEISWRGHPHMPAGQTRAGEIMLARFCHVLEFEDGLIIRQRHYDCYEPF